MRRRPPGRDWMRPITDRLTPSVKTIIIAQACIYFFYVFVRQVRVPMAYHLAIGPGLFAGEIWQPVTSLFVNLDFLGFLFGVVGLTFIGAFVERAQGTRRFFAFFVIAGVLANVTLAAVWRLRTAAASRPIPYDDGPSFSLMAMFVAFGRVHGRAQAQLWPLPFAVQARYLVLILVGWFVAANLVRGDWPAIAGDGGDLSWSAYLGAGPVNLREAWKLYKARRVRSQYRVLEGGRRKPKKKYLN